jgi:formate C-acetyltransferase
MLENEGNPDISWDGLIQQIRDKIRYYIKLMVEGSNICDIGHRDWAPVPLLSSFIEDCVQHGKDITEGGARYNFSGVQGIGIANLSDSCTRSRDGLRAAALSFDELIQVLKANFQTPEGEKIRARLIHRFEKYGNDIDEVDNISADLLRFYCKEVEQYRNPRGGHFTRFLYRLGARAARLGGRRNPGRPPGRRAAGGRRPVADGRPGFSGADGGAEIGQQAG